MYRKEAITPETASLGLVHQSGKAARRTTRAAMIAEATGNPKQTKAKQRTQGPSIGIGQLGNGLGGVLWVELKATYYFAAAAKAATANTSLLN